MDQLTALGGWSKCDVGKEKRADVALVTSHKPVWVPAEEFIVAGRDLGQRESTGRVGPREIGMIDDENMSPHPVVSGPADEFDVAQPVQLAFPHSTRIGKCDAEEGGPTR